MNFREMHHQLEPLLICNVWDAASARMAQRAGFQAMATSSFAIAAMLGYKDGEQLSFQELLYLVKRIVAVTSLPFSVDIEGGYSREPDQVIANIRELAGLGVVGINIEDSVVGSQRELVDAEAFAGRIASIKAGLQAAGCDVFLNVRTDGFLVGRTDARAETVRRGVLYAQAGADGLFAPCILREDDIAALVRDVPLPLNVLALPGVPAFPVMQALGVKRISMGNALFDRLQHHLETRLAGIRAELSLAPMLDDQWCP